MTQRTELYGELASIDVERMDDESGNLRVRITVLDGSAESARVDLFPGCFAEDAESLAAVLEQAAKEARAIVDGWEDRPSGEGDGFVSFDSYYRGGSYLVMLEGSRWDGDTLWPVGQGPHIGFPTQDIAEYELERAMQSAGCFPNTWYEDDRGYPVAIDVSKYSDDEGKMKPLKGAEYEDGAAIDVDGMSAFVIRDYGVLGIVFRYEGDDERQYTDQRELVKPAPEEVGV